MAPRPPPGLSLGGHGPPYLAIRISIAMKTGTPFENTIFTVQADSFQIASGKCDILDMSGSQILWATLLSFPYFPKIRVYEAKSRRTEILKVNRPREFGPMLEMYDYPVLDSISKSRIGTVRLTNDGWTLLDHSNQKMGYFNRVQELEDEIKLAVWHGYADDVRVCQLCQVVERDLGINLRITVDCSLDIQGQLDRRLTLSSVLVKMALEAAKFHTGL